MRFQHMKEVTNANKMDKFEYCGSCGGYKGDFTPLLSHVSAQPKACNCKPVYETAEEFYKKRLEADDEYDFDKGRLKDFIAAEMEAYAIQRIKGL